MASEAAAGRAPRLDQAGERRLAELAGKGWQAAAGHPLVALQGLPVGPLRLLVLLGPRNNVGARYFQLLAVDAAGSLVGPRLALGIYNSGPFPAFNWVELTHYEPRPALGASQTGLAANGHDLPLFRALSALVPPGGHLMVEYDSPSQEATARVLTLGYPPVCSPLGYRLFQVGVRSYRDWYISEGGREGPRKLQGFKPLNAEIAREKTAALLREVESVLDSPPRHGQWGEIARANAAAAAEAIRASVS